MNYKKWLLILILISFLSSNLCFGELDRSALARQAPGNNMSRRRMLGLSALLAGVFVPAGCDRKEPERPQVAPLPQPQAQKKVDVGQELKDLFRSKLNELIAQVYDDNLQQYGVEIDIEDLKSKVKRMADKTGHPQDGFGEKLALIVAKNFKCHETENSSNSLSVAEMEELGRVQLEMLKLINELNRDYLYQYDLHIRNFEPDTRAVEAGLSRPYILSYAIKEKYEFRINDKAIPGIFVEELYDLGRLNLLDMVGFRMEKGDFTVINLTSWDRQYQDMPLPRKEVLAKEFPGRDFEPEARLKDKPELKAFLRWMIMVHELRHRIDDLIVGHKNFELTNAERITEEDKYNVIANSEASAYLAQIVLSGIPFLAIGDMMALLNSAGPFMPQGLGVVVALELISREAARRGHIDDDQTISAQLGIKDDNDLAVKLLQAIQKAGQSKYQTALFNTSVAILESEEIDKKELTKICANAYEKYFGKSVEAEPDYTAIRLNEIREAGPIPDQTEPARDPINTSA